MMRLLVITTLLIGITAGVSAPVAAAEQSAARKPVSAVKPDAAKSVSPDHAAKMARGLEIFKNDVRAILVNKCVGCHGKDAVEGEFNLASRKDLLKGGAGGAVVVPGDAKRSKLYRLVARLEQPYMPYEEEKLSQREVSQIAEWIDHFAPYDKPLVAGDTQAVAIDWTKTEVPPDAREFWSLQPLKRVSPPSVKNPQRCNTPIDRFVQARLEEQGLTPNLPVSRRQYIRRVYLDLLGLPPTPEEIAAFIEDKSPDAFEKLIDRLLADPHYGERWARHWLDLARFAESHGFEHDYDRQYAYHFRDFVIRALNDDLPYDTFVRWQLAGDEFAPENNLAMMATGFLAAGVHSTQITKNEVEKHRYDELDDMVNTSATAFLGLTVGCARCHDHKYDPIPQADYYRMVSAFTTTIRSEIFLDFAPEDPEAKPVDRNQPVQAHRPNYIKVLVSSEGLEPVRLHSQGADFLEQTHFLRRGDPSQKLRVAKPGYLQVLMRTPDKAQRWNMKPPAETRTSFQRAALANWITDTRNGAGHLLARVIVNRLWQHHLGRGIVSTPSDFGERGESPTHPELLDWLASELIRHNWRLKPIHKLIVLSSVYRQSADENERNVKLDDNNRFFWRFERRRVEGEPLRDILLAVSGSLETRMFGPGTLDPAQRRRSIYFTVKRSQMIPMMQVFDAPEPLSGVARRPSTTIAPQALLLMNNPQIHQYAENFAAKLFSIAERSFQKAVRRGYLTALGREPTAGETADNVAFLESQTSSYRSDGNENPLRSALADFCQVLFCLNEFAYVD